MRIHGVGLVLILTALGMEGHPAEKAIAKSVTYMGVAIETSSPFVEIENPLTQPVIKSGILLDLGEALAKELGVQARMVPLPKKRVAPDLVSGEISIVCYTHPFWLPAVKNQVYWSKDIYTNTNFIVTAGKKKVTKISDLYGKRVGGIVNYYYPSLDAAFESKKIHRENAPNNESNVQKLLYGRIDYLILSNLEYAYHKKKNPELIAHDLGMDTRKVKCALSKKSKITLAELNHAIDNLKKNGTLEKIFTP